MHSDGRDGELSEGTLHGMLVKKLGERQVECYSRWLWENKKERSVVNFNELLKEEVRVRVEAKEMVHGVAVAEARQNENLSIARGKHGHGGRGRSHSFYTGGAVGGSKETKPPCGFCEGSHGVWSCKRFQALDVQERWNVAKSRRLCFRCLGSFHQGRVCPRSKPCNVNRCTKNHHNLLHDTKMDGKQPESDKQLPTPPWEGAVDSRTNVTDGKRAGSEMVSLRTIPVWLKKNNRKVKVNAILDDALNETFLNKEVAGMLGIQEPFQTIKVHVLNNEIETFQSMPVNVTIESVDGQFRKSIDVKTCPRKVTGSYKMEDWRESKTSWNHLNECDFPEPAETDMWIC